MSIAEVDRKARGYGRQSRACLRASRPGSARPTAFSVCRALHGRSSGGFSAIGIAAGGADRISGVSARARPQRAVVGAPRSGMALVRCTKNKIPNLSFSNRKRSCDTQGSRTRGRHNTHISTAARPGGRAARRLTLAPWSPHEPSAHTAHHRCASHLRAHLRRVAGGANKRMTCREHGGVPAKANTQLRRVRHASGCPIPRWSASLDPSPRSPVRHHHAYRHTPPVHTRKTHKQSLRSEPLPLPPLTEMRRGTHAYSTASTTTCCST